MYNYSCVTTTACLSLLCCYLTGGIIQHHCSGSDLGIDHAIQIVGYDLTGTCLLLSRVGGREEGRKGKERCCISLKCLPSLCYDHGR